MVNAKLAEESKVEFLTTRFGLVEASEENIIRFIDEIPGFQEAKRFVLIPHAENSPFNWLQSVDIPEVAFVVTNPWLFFENYKPIISEGDLENLEFDSGSDENIVLFSILTIPNDPHKITVNLKAPVIVNARNNTAKQVILVNEDYVIRHPLLSES